MKDLLIELYACDESIEWAGDKSWTEIYATCDRADWLMWLFARTNPDDVRLRILVAGLCANTVRHLMTNDRSIAAVDAAIAFGEGRISDKELEVASMLDYNATVGTSVAAVAAYYAAASAYYAAFAPYASTSTYYAARSTHCAFHSASKKGKHQALMADIVRKHIPIEKFNIQT